MTTKTETLATRILAIGGDDDPGGPQMVDLVRELMDLTVKELVDLTLELAATAVVTAQALGAFLPDLTYHELLAALMADN